MIHFNMFKKNKMYERLYTIRQYVDTFNINKCSKIKDVLQGYKSISFIFVSDQGPVSIKFTYPLDTASKFEYVNYAGVKVFTIIASEYMLDIKPMLDGENTITPHEIDLAIYEIETYLKECFGDVKQYLKQKEENYEKKLKIHNKLLEYFR